MRQRFSEKLENVYLSRTRTGTHWYLQRSEAQASESESEPVTAAATRPGRCLTGTQSRLHWPGPQGCGAAAGNHAHCYIGKVCCLLLVRAEDIRPRPGRGPEGTGHCSSCYGGLQTRVQVNSQCSPARLLSRYYPEAAIFDTRRRPGGGFSLKPAIQPGRLVVCLPGWARAVIRRAGLAAAA